MKQLIATSKSGTKLNYYTIKNFIISHPKILNGVRNMTPEQAFRRAIDLQEEIENACGTDKKVCGHTFEWAEEKKYGITETFDILGREYLTGNTVRKRESIDVGIYKVNRNSLRYMLFFQKGTTCVKCGRQGAYFKLDVHSGKRIKGATPRRHFNLYCEDGVMMTKDHIYPASLGGPDTIDNLQPMCCLCNVEKGVKIETEPEFRSETAPS